jgi:hypothetical protein
MQAMYSHSIGHVHIDPHLVALGYQKVTMQLVILDSHFKTTVVVFLIMNLFLPCQHFVPDRLA